MKFSSTGAGPQVNAFLVVPDPICESDNEEVVEVCGADPCRALVGVAVKKGK